MVHIGPVSCSVGPATFENQGIACNQFDTGQLGTGVIVSVQGTVTPSDNGVQPQATYDQHVVAYDVNNNSTSFFAVQGARINQGPQTWNVILPVTTSRIVLSGNVTLAKGQIATLAVDADYTTRTYCQYGTELTTPGTLLYYITPGLIDTWLATLHLPWLAPVFTGLWFTAIDAKALCGSGPPALPVLDFSTLQSSATAALQLLKVVAWPNLCRCTAGSPPAVPYPLPSPAQPAGWLPPLTFPCDPSATCAALQTILSQLAALQSQVRAIGDNTTSAQRYSTPFAYIRGAVHSGLVASGSFAIPRCVGIQVTVTQRPMPGSVLAGNPAYVRDLGWISLTNSDGLLVERRVSQSAFAWLPPEAQLADHFSYAFRDQVVAAVTELYAEP